MQAHRYIYVSKNGTKNGNKTITDQYYKLNILIYTLINVLLVINYINFMFINVYEIQLFLTSFRDR